MNRLLRGTAQTVQPYLAGYAAVLFCTHPLAGLAILAVTFVRPEVGVGGVIAAVAAKLVCRSAGYSEAEERSALCNALLVGLAIAFGFRLSLLSLGLAVSGGVFAALVTRVLAGWIHRLNHLPVLSLGFVLVTWLFLAICRDIPGIEAAPPTLYWHLAPNWMNSFFVSLGWFLFTPDPLAGGVMFAVLLASSRYLALLCVAGYLIGALTLVLLGSTVQPEIAGFNFILAAIAVGGVYSFPDRVSFAWALFAAFAAALLCMGFPALLGRLGVPPLALPFLLATWLVLGALAARSHERRPHLLLDSPSLPERGLLAARLARARLIEPGSYPVGVPFSGDWKVSQAYDGPHTHRGLWRHAYDFLLVDPHGQSFRGEGRQLDDYHCFGIPVLAPVAGQVWRCRDDLPDNRPGELDVRAGRNFGNYVMLRTADGAFALLGHLKQGSLAVKAGQWLEIGMPVAACGNSGRSTQPHLHLQLQASDELGAPTRPFHLRSVLVKRRERSGPWFHLSCRPAEGDIVCNAMRDHGLAAALHLSAGRTLGFRDEFDKLHQLRIEVGLLGQFRMVSAEGSSAAFEETPNVLAVYDKKGRPSPLLDAWVLALGLTPFSNGAQRWDDAPQVELAPLSLGQRLLLPVLRPFGANFTSNYERHWDEVERAWRQTGRHRLQLLPGVDLTVISEALIDLQYGCRQISVSNGILRLKFMLAEVGALGDVGIPRQTISLAPEPTAGQRHAPAARRPTEVTQTG
jgi:urea transporter